MTDKLRGTLEKYSRDNWNKIPEDSRRKCVDHLRSAIPDESVALFCKQYKAGERFGADHLGWHFGGGMMVRNVLRQVMSDTELPPVKYEDITAQNWDDYYTGALEQLCEDEAARNVQAS